MIAFALVLALSATSTIQQADTPQLQSETYRTGNRDSLLARARELLAAHQLPEARRIAEALQDRNHDDAAALMLLARIHLAWPVVGRFEAESLLRRAAKLRPGDPEPLYYLGQVGQALGSDDGESIARNGFLPVLALNPDYRDAWSRWTTLYRANGERRAAISVLERHAGDWDADYWRGQLLVEQLRYDDADSLLKDVIRRRPDDPGALAWRARALFAAGRSGEATIVYDRAVANAERDTGSVLWRQVRGIASASEKERWIHTPPEQRPAFFRRFWAGRNPDLFAATNPRLTEHFQRLAEAARFYSLLHPAARYFHSRMFRAMVDYRGEFPDIFNRAAEHSSALQCTARPFGVRDTTLLSGLAPHPMAESDTLPNLEDGLDDRGRIFLRHGRPNYRLVGSLDDETWCYVNPDGTTMQVTFVRRHGFLEVTPLRSGEGEAASLLLATDESSLRSTLSFSFWQAPFRAADREHTELLLMPDSVSGIALLIDDEGREVARDTATGRPLRLVAEPGHYLLLLNGRVDQRVGRFRTSVFLPDYDVDAPVISGMLLASGALPPDRETLAANAPHGLVLPATEPFRVYTELYNMGRVDSVTRYIAEYRFERLDGFILTRGRQRSTTVTFPREVGFASRIVESLVIDPGRLPPGRYRLVLQINDEVRGVTASSALIEFRLR